MADFFVLVEKAQRKLLKPIREVLGQSSAKGF
jgi:hypothetical protein